MTSEQGNVMTVVGHPAFCHEEVNLMPNHEVVSEYSCSTVRTNEEGVFKLKLAEFKG